VIAAPRGGAAGVSTDALASLHDLAATFLDWAGVAPLPGMDAVSLRPVVEGRRESHRPVAVAGLADWRMVTGERHKLVVSPAHPPLLFDRPADEWEDYNLAADRPNVVDRLRMHLV